MVCARERRTAGTKSAVAPMFRGLGQGTGGTEPEVATMLGQTGCGQSGEWYPDAAGGVVPLPCRDVRMGQLMTGGMVTSRGLKVRFRPRVKFGSKVDLNLGDWHRP